MKIYFPFLFFIFIMALVCSCDSKTYQRAEGLIWNTAYHSIYESDKNLEDSIIITLERVGKSLSFFDEHSLVSKVNNQKETEVDSLFIKVYLASKSINQKSGKAFDPTLSPLISAWGFGKDHDVSTDTAAIDSIREFIGIEKTSLNGRILFKEDIRTQFNFSAIAKGYGCDLVAEMFHRNGVKNFMIEIGGEIVLSGRSQRGDDWKISIDAPEYETVEGGSFKIIKLTDCGIATSGNYRNYHEEDGNKFGHTISPSTGRPVQTDVLSATVIAGDCMTADAVATSCMVMGSQKALTLLEEMNLQGFLILADTVVMTPGFAKFIYEDD